jgi:bisphosphoglycerate-dependent phosphoglycerate mutase
MVDVLEEIKSLLVFESEDDFYFLQILQRKKENSEIGSNSRVIKNYYINSVEYLEKRYDEIKLLCNQFNARAMLRLNKRSYSKVAFKTMQNIANSMANGEYSFIKKSYDRACGNGHNDKNKTWIVDIDKEEVIWLEQIINAIQSCEPISNKIVKQLSTKNGIHLITTPFNVMQFKENFKKELEAYKMEEINIDIHKDNPINLFIP